MRVVYLAAAHKAAFPQLALGHEDKLSKRNLKKQSAFISVLVFVFPMVIIRVGGRKKSEVSMGGGVIGEGGGVGSGTFEPLKLRNFSISIFKNTFTSRQC